MPPNKLCSCCDGKKKKNDKEPIIYPAGIQKDDLLWSYFVMKLICQVLGDPLLLKRVQDRQKDEPTTMFDMAMMCCAAKNPDAFKAAMGAVKAENAIKASGIEEKMKELEEAKQQQQRLIQEQLQQTKHEEAEEPEEQQPQENQQEQQQQQPQASQ